jgi:hypothetical protein
VRHSGQFRIIFACKHPWGANCKGKRSILQQNLKDWAWINKVWSGASVMPTKLDFAAVNRH